MNLPIGKNISASAGTGKTYRLSLEYIALLLRYYDNPEFKPEQILVITFTRKATAEIRERIYSHLKALTDKSPGWQVIMTNLKQLSDTEEQTEPDNTLSEKELLLLSRAYRFLITHEEQLQVMTIDSYIHSIFRNLVRPVRGIDRFDLDLKAVDKRMPFLFNELMTPIIRIRIQNLLSRKLKPALDEYQSFFRSLIDNRWLFYLAKVRSVQAEEDTLAYYTNHPSEWQTKANEHQINFIRLFDQIIDSVSEFIKTKFSVVLCQDAIGANAFNKEFLQLFSPLPENVLQLKDELRLRLNDDWFLLKLMNLFAGEKFIWNGTKIRASNKNTEVDEWKKWHQEAGKHLANHLVFRLVLPEQTETLDIWNDVLQHYDKLIYRYKNFTYDDIAWFTFEALYSSFPPLFKAESEEVANEFYDFMSRRTRFMLIDEFQDTSILQFNILKPMIEELISGEGTKPYGGFIVVGDEKQSIFGWRGGQRDLLLNMHKIFPSMIQNVQVSLTDSWRSSPILMDFINGVFKNDDLRDFLLENDSVWKYQDIKGQKTELDADTLIRFKLQNYTNSVPEENLPNIMRSFVEKTVIPSLPKQAEKHRSIAILARKNDELEMIRCILAEHGITGEFQSSKSLLDHPVIKAMLFLLRFCVYNDWYDLLAFLRSDLLLINGKDLKLVINTISDFQQNKDKEKAQIVFTGQPIAQAVYELSGQLDSNRIWYSCMQILQACQIPYKVRLERDFINIRRWLDIAWQYEATYQSELPSLQGFLRYCEENRAQEAFQQQDVESSSAIQLLTIHKSKGLEFDSVYVWWNLRSSTAQEDNRLKSYVQYADSGFEKLSDIALTLHYKKVLAASSYKDIMEKDEQRIQLEELNNLYVALTRAKCRLFIYTVFPKKGDWQDYLEGYKKTDKLAPQHYAAMAMLDYMQKNACLKEDGSWQIGNPVDASTVNIPVLFEELPVNDNLQAQTTSAITAKLKRIIPDWQNPVEICSDTNEDEPEINWKHSFLVNRENLRGSIAHFYLAQIKYAEQSEIETARILTYRQFGNLMRRDEMEILLDKVETLLPALKDIFHPDYDIIFTEYPIFHQGKEYRIDRLMLNTKAKSYRLIDYKTGGIHQQEQLAFYDKLVQKLLSGEFVAEHAPEYVAIKV